MENVAGVVCYVKDTLKTVEFYRQLGFIVDKAETDHVSVHLGEFWMDFHPQDKEDKPEFQTEANLQNKGAGLFLYFRVRNADAFYEEITGKGLKPSSEPRDWPWGNREFVVRDPDGYKLVFFHSINK